MTGIEPAYSSNRCGIRTSGVVVEVIGSVVADFPGRAPFRLPQVLRELPSGGPQQALVEVRDVPIGRRVQGDRLRGFLRNLQRHITRPSQRNRECAVARRFDLPTVGPKMVGDDSRTDESDSTDSACFTGGVDVFRSCTIPSIW